tara:strand:- start:649 stop:2070 length:1422 start_codon:yes stop_codon:yes gene_type:complete
MKNVYALKKEKEVADDYLVKPFFKTVDDENFFSTTGVMKILVGVTGQGKTYNTAHSFIPHLAKNHNVDIVIVSVPTTEILDVEDFWVSAGKANMQHKDDVKEAIGLLENDQKVLLTTTHQSLVVAEKGGKLQEYLKTSGKTFAIFIDEAHTWLVSDANNYKNVNGWYGTNYEATMFKSLAELSVISPYIFGLTATPNGEQIGKIPTVGGMDFNVINTFPPKDLLIAKTAYLNGINFFDDELKDSFAIQDKYENAIIKLFADGYKSGIKKTMMVSVGNYNQKEGYNLEYVKHLTTVILNTNSLVSEDTKVIAIMTGDKKITGSYAINGSFEKLDENEIKEKLNDPNDPLSIVIVVQKGTMGMNIYTLKSLVSFKPSNKKDKSGNALTEFAIQTLGRLVRLNTGLSVKEFTKKYGYDLNEYVKTLSKEEIEKLLIGNSFDILVPDNVLWNVALNSFQDKYVSSVQQAKSWINSIS